MAPDISEFSYGFALTNELVDRYGDLRFAPIFPSLLEEGKPGGGYDLQIGGPTFPIFVQFKLSHKMMTRRAKEISRYKLPIIPPFFRFSIMDSRHSKQHEMLLSLENAGNEVFYAAPRFHTHEELNAAFNKNSVSADSTFVRPSTIGHLTPGSHTCAIDHSTIHICSEPFSAEGLSVQDLRNSITGKLDENLLRFGPDLTEFLLDRYQRASERIEDSENKALMAYDQYIETYMYGRFQTTGQPARPIGLRYRELVSSLSEKVSLAEGTFEKISKLSEFSTNIFGAQLFVVQRK
ncbi:hypothetical protein [Henriciella litoralis]|uniref:hypothetical protein n=1 Tax=Henriciella litoralis TaxID=568102 RepID=UPI0009FC5DF9|nr:hypothetical protein [Henriciella litoralis]